MNITKATQNDNNDPPTDKQQKMFGMTLCEDYQGHKKMLEMFPNLT